MGGKSWGKDNKGEKVGFISRYLSSPKPDTDPKSAIVICCNCGNDIKPSQVANCPHCKGDKK